MKVNEETNLSFKNKEKLDSVLSFIFIKKLIKPIKTTKAFELGLVDNNGKSVKKPETEEEKLALSPLDKTIFKIKRLLGSRVAKLNAFLYMNSLNDDWQNQLIVPGALSKKSAIIRMNRDIESIIEKYGFDMETGLKLIIAEEYKKGKIKE